MKRFLFGLASVCLFSASEAMACSCAPPSTPQDFIDGHEHIFSGQVLSGSIVQGQPGVFAGSGVAGGVVSVSQVYKGDVGSVALIRSALSSATCGVPITIGQSVTVFTTRADDGTYGMNLCSQLPFDQDRAAIQAALDALGGASQIMRLDGPVELNQRFRLVPIPPN